MVMSASRPFNTAVNHGSLFGRRLNITVTISLRDNRQVGWIYGYSEQKTLVIFIPFLTGLKAEFCDDEDDNEHNDNNDNDDYRMIIMMMMMMMMTTSQ